MSTLIISKKPEQETPKVDLKSVLKKNPKDWTAQEQNAVLESMIKNKSEYPMV